MPSGPYFYEASSTGLLGQLGLPYPPASFCLLGCHHLSPRCPGLKGGDIAFLGACLCPPGAEDLALAKALQFGLSVTPMEALVAPPGTLHCAVTGANAVSGWGRPPFCHSITVSITA